MTKQPSFLAKAAEKLLKNKLAALCFVLLVLEVLLLLITPWIAPHDPEATNAAIKFAPGFWAKFSSDPAVRASYVPGYLLGTDNLGRDTLSRLLWGGRVSLTVGVVSTAMGLFLGVILGMLAGYYPKLDNPIMRFMDLLFTFPGVLLAMLIIGMLGSSTFNATLAISIWSVPSFARMVRGKVLQIKQEDYILAIRSLGRHRFPHHLLPCAQKCPAADHRHCHHAHGFVHYLHLHPELSGYGRSGSRAGMGQHDRHRQGLHVGSPRAHHHSRLCRDDHCHLLQHSGRQAPGYPGPQPA